MQAKEELLEQLGETYGYVSEFAEKRQKQALDWMWALIEEGLKDRFYKNREIVKALPDLKRAVVDGSVAPAAAADELLFFLDNRDPV